MFSSFIENSYATYSLDDGIVLITYKVGTCLDFKAAVEVVQDRLILQKDKPYPVLCNIMGVKSINKSARDYLAIEGSVLISAVAFIIEPPISVSISEFYLRASKPTVPTKIFTELEEAKGFLYQYMV